MDLKSVMVPFLPMLMFCFGFWESEGSRTAGDLRFVVFMMVLVGACFHDDVRGEQIEMSLVESR